ncbi:MAG: hypothetical protein B0D92_05200 [Spirochaeta sp. LUC14_002_19_P3]|nr:MAG: hypothetical protein B0D92_05200 [Spirochaeta sp. LUC14_002_19_P3]
MINSIIELMKLNTMIINISCSIQNFMQVLIIFIVIQFKLVCYHFIQPLFMLSCIFIKSQVLHAGTAEFLLPKRLHFFSRRKVHR